MCVSCVSCVWCVVCGLCVWCVWFCLGLSRGVFVHKAESCKPCTVHESTAIQLMESLKNYPTHASASGPSADWAPFPRVEAADLSTIVRTLPP